MFNLKSFIETVDVETVEVGCGCGLELFLGIIITGF